MQVGSSAILEINAIASSFDCSRSSGASAPAAPAAGRARVQDTRLGECIAYLDSGGFRTHWDRLRSLNSFRADAMSPTRVSNGPRTRPSVNAHKKAVTVSTPFEAVDDEAMRHARKSYASGEARVKAINRPKSGEMIWRRQTPASPLDSQRTFQLKPQPPNSVREKSVRSGTRGNVRHLTTRG